MRSDFDIEYWGIMTRGNAKRTPVDAPQLWEATQLRSVPPPRAPDEEEPGPAQHGPGFTTAETEADVLVLLLTIPQAAKALGIGRSTLYELIADGELEAVHIRRSVRVPMEAVQAFVQKLRTTASPQG